MLENIEVLRSATAEKGVFFEEGFPEAQQLSFQKHRLAQATLSTAAGKLGLASAVRRRIEASVRSLCEGPIPAVLVSVTGLLGGSNTGTKRYLSEEWVLDEWRIRRKEQATAFLPGQV